MQHPGWGFVLALAAATGVAATCKAEPLPPQWQPPVQIHGGTVECYGSFCNQWGVAADGSTVHAVWWRRWNGNSGPSEIWYRRSDDAGVSWGEEVRLDSDEVASMYPSIAVSGGTVHVVWVQGTDPGGTGPCQIHYRRSTDGGASWGPEIALSNAPAGGDSYGAWFPSAAAAGPRVHVVWEDDRNDPDMIGACQIFYRRSTDDGGTWGPETLLESRFDMETASIAASDDHVYTAYYNYALDNNIYVKRSGNGGQTWSAGVVVASSPFGADWPCIAADGADVHLVWQDGRDDGLNSWETFYKRSTDYGASWGTDLELTHVLGNTWSANCAASGPRVHVVWMDMVSYQDHYVGSTDAGLSWGMEKVLTDSIGGGDHLHYSVAGVDSTVHFLCDATNSIWFRGTAGGAAGVEADGGVPGVCSQGLRAAPNPFAVATKVLGREEEPFAVFDVTGRLMAIDRGGRIGGSLPEGVYFLRPRDGRNRPLRIVKIR